MGELYNLNDIMLLKAFILWNL